jgi:UDP-N-acetylglucosamine--N-acetylmuramyl-(pentapeptide) pyrophosphoryl-undecaprenol N-acetylglucosamine transferase
VSGGGGARTVLFAGGGTAGHVFPAVAVARALVRLDAGVAPRFVGTRHRLEGRLVPAAGFELHHIDVLPLPRRPSPRLLKAPLAMGRAIRRCGALVEDTDAAAAITFGGYVGFPLAWAAHRARLPLVVHEQNSVPGLANRVAAQVADRVAVTFPGSADRFPHPERVVVTGNPVRGEILAPDQRAARPAAVRHFRLDPERRTVLVFGGSQGARSLNRAAVASFGGWWEPGRLQLLHAAGRDLYGDALEGWERAREGTEGPLVRCVDFIDDMAAAYAVADVVVCRSGATSIAELTALGKPAVLVPYPHATGAHQKHNALALQRAGGARVVFDHELTGGALIDAVQPLLHDDRLRASLAEASAAFGRRDAAENVARLVARLAGAGGGRRRGPAAPGRTDGGAT